MGSAWVKVMHSCRDTYQEVGWQPAANVYRLTDGWLAKFDLAGVRTQDIQVSVRGPCLTISGIRRDWLSREGLRAYSMEIPYNRFQRSIEFPCDLSAAQIAVEYRDGMLLVRLMAMDEGY